MLLFRRRPSDPVIALLAFGMLALPAGEITILLADGIVRSAVGRTFTIGAAIGLMLSMSVFPAGRFTPRWTAWLIPALLVAIAIIIGFQLPTIAGQILLTATLVVVLTALVQRFRRLDPGPQRQQIKWAVLGFAGMVFFGLLAITTLQLRLRADGTSAYLALAITNSLTNFLAYISLAGGLVISLLRHRLYDADAAISRSALYGGMTLFLVAVFAAFGKLFETLGEEYFGDTAGTAAGAIAAGIAALLLVPLHNRLSRWSENRFQRDIARMRAALPELLAEMRDSDDPDELADDALRLVIAGVRAKHGVILLPAEDGGWRASEVEGLPAEGLAARLSAELPVDPAPGLLRADDSELPLRLPLLTPSGILAGWIALGPHPDGSLYGKDDREALEEVASPLARALCLTLKRARREAEREADRQAMAERMARLDETLGRLVGLVAPKGANAA